MMRAASLRRRLSFASRIVAAVAGGYGLVSLLTVALSLCLPALGMRQIEAVVATTAGSFVVYAGVIMGVFHARSAARAWLWLALASAPAALAVILLLPDAA